MIAKVGSYIEIINPTEEVEKWCHDNLVLDNPEYEKKARLGFWTENTPRTISLYGNLGDRIDVPFGCLRPLLPCFNLVTLKPLLRVRCTQEYLVKYHFTTIRKLP